MIPTTVHNQDGVAGALASGVRESAVVGEVLFWFMGNLRDDQFTVNSLQLFIKTTEACRGFPTPLIRMDVTRRYLHRYERRASTRVFQAHRRNQRN
jgi:hypothetical protein